MSVEIRTFGGTGLRVSRYCLGATMVLDRIDALVPPGTELDPRDTTASNPALEDPRERRRPR